MPAVVLTLLTVAIVASIALLARMYVRKDPFYGAVGLAVMTIPCSVLALLYQAVS
jgi:hypothetical protein